MKKQGYVCMNNGTKIVVQFFLLSHFVGCGYCIHKKCLSRAFNETGRKQFFCVSLGIVLI